MLGLAPVWGVDDGMEGVCSLFLLSLFLLSLVVVGAAQAHAPFGVVSGTAAHYDLEAC